jgi:hypothetical protein
MIKRRSLRLVAGAVVRAYVRFQADEASSEPTNLMVAGEATGNSAPFTSAKFIVSSRPRTAASIPWSPPAWTRSGLRGAEQRTPDLSPVLQEIVDGPGWLPRNALALIITGRVGESPNPSRGTPPPFSTSNTQFLDPRL